MNQIDEFRNMRDLLKKDFDDAKEALDNLIEQRRTLTPDAEYDTLFDQKKAEADYHINNIQMKLDILDFKIEIMETFQ